MVEVAFLAFAALIGVQDAVIVSSREPRQPDVMASAFEARCGRRTITLGGIGGSGPGAEAPTLKLNGRRLALPTDVQAFLFDGRAAYRVSAVCPDTAPAFQIRVYRAAAVPDGHISYELWSLDVTSAGQVVDRGPHSADADAYWYR